MFERVPVGLFCPFQSRLNRHVTDVQSKSVDWAERMDLIHGDSQRDKLAGARIAYLVARAFPESEQLPLQIAADWTTLFCIADDYAERLSDPAKVTEYFLGLISQFRLGEQPRDPFGRALADLRDRTSAIASEWWVHRFADHIQDIFIGFAWESINRERRSYCNLHSYEVLRQTTVGLYPQFHLAILTDGIELPISCWDHPQVERLMAAASNCVGWANDIFTYEKELQAGETHNLVFVLMETEGMSLPEALREAISMHNQEIEDFVLLTEALDDFGPHTAEVRRLVDVLAAWIGGHLEWAQETGRYRPEDQYFEVDNTGEFEIDELVLEEFRPSAAAG